MNNPFNNMSNPFHNMSMSDMNPWRQPAPRGTDPIAVAALVGVGVLFGAAAALLLAPKSGREVREDIRIGAGRVGERASELGSNVSDRLYTLIPASMAGAKTLEMHERVEA